MKMFEILDMEGVLQKLATKELPFKTLHKVAKLIELLEKEKEFYQRKFQWIIDFYAERDELGGYLYTDDTQTAVKIKPDKIDECQEKMNELLNIDLIGAPEIYFSLEELESLTLSYAEARQLIKLVQE